ncbi:hypothetical protein L1049_003786 [Liquidambar formosana]|uniref:Uncharacterized protein n=1 Tax=Liquidambar formosana TaxID=63359 RepID=A0AAP0RRR3_LIQFO
MEGKNVKALVVAVMVMVMSIGHATASFRECYAACYADCISVLRHSMPYVQNKLLPCALKCLKKCFHPADDHLYYYATKMESCVDNCSNKDCNIKH